ncbi:histidine triad (HIT) family protein [Lederbergia galactosidilyticus]|uniref:HIT family protein n=1 Tax=Lederbergia galactosidilytica TaxID=217031 RepID=UPI001AE5FF0B|nr:HIT family protein [Lederbergia galactosidilytica]MBP1915729.1 histidine triad (HIT) family protein [Lederbergia galactosidilytica]
MSDCIFCKIINGEIPSAKVFENDDVLAFLDISQVTKGHTLVIPKIHKKDVFDLEAETAEKLFSVVPAISRALRSEFDLNGLNMINNNGSFAGQEVFHYHLHLVPRYNEKDGIQKKFISHQSEYTADDLQQIASTINQAIQP